MVGPRPLALLTALLVQAAGLPLRAEPEPVEPAPPDRSAPAPAQPRPEPAPHPAPQPPYGQPPYTQPPYAQPPDPQPPVARTMPPPSDLQVAQPYGPLIGLALRAGIMVPTGDGYAGVSEPGLLVDLSFWYEGKYFAIEPRIGIRFDLVRGPDSFVELPLDLGGYFIFGGSSLAGFVGGGIGAHHIWETRGEDIVLGSLLPARLEKRSHDRGWGFGGFGRAGLIFTRSMRQRVILSVEYNVTVVELNGFANPTSFTAGIGFVR